MGEKLLEDVDTYDEARGRLHSIVDILVSSGLLLKDEYGRKTMHDVVRDVAVSISTKERGHVVKAGRNLRYWPDMKLGNCNRLSMMYNPIKGVSTIQIKATHLQALFLNNNTYLTELPPNVFGEMKSLMTLDLSHTSIEYLPPSLSCLENLNTLLLNQTDLRNLSPIENLERLEVLSLYGCESIEEFPEEMGNLSNLRILDLAYTSFKKSINRNLISKFHRLETFHLFESDVSIPNPNNYKNIELFREVGSLSRLTSLRLGIYDTEVCHTEIPGPWENLTTFQIFVRSQFKNDMLITGLLKNLWLEGIRGKQLPNWVLVLLRKTNYLELSWCPDLVSLTDELGAAASGMNHNLKELELTGCSKMECVINHTGLLESNENAFSNLETLRIKGMRAFVEICKGANPPPTGLLYKLKNLYFTSCPSLVTAVPRKLICNLLNLESLLIDSCQDVLNVVEAEEEEEESSPPSNIGRISGPIFPNLERIKIDKCTKIRYVFTMNVARNLLNLEALEIIDCGEMEVLLKYEDGEDIKCLQDAAILPRLKRLIVRNAPKLKSFTNRNLLMELPSLEGLEISKCEILERLPFGTTSVPNLRRVKVGPGFFDRLEWEAESVKSRLTVLQRSFQLGRKKLYQSIIDSCSLYKLG